MGSIFDRLSVVLVSTRNPLNIGAAARAMSNFGFHDLRVVTPFDVAFREAKSAVGASTLLRNTREYESVADAIADSSLVIGSTAARSRKLDHKLQPLRVGARLMRKQLQTRQVALLFGSEKRGLSNRELSYCHWLLRIPTREEHPSMNLGQAVSICLYELARDEPIAMRAENKPAATGSELERLSAILCESLQTAGYPGAGDTESTQDKVRRLLRRMSLSAADAQLWSGMLRQMLWKMRSKD